MAERRSLFLMPTLRNNSRTRALIPLISQVGCTVIAVALCGATAYGQYSRPESLQEDKYIDYSEWIKRTDKGHSIDERMEAISSLEAIASRQLFFCQASQRTARIDWVKDQIAPTLTKLLDSDTPIIRGRAAGAFCSLRNANAIVKPVIPRLVQLFRDPDLYVRSHAVGVFAFMGSDAEPAVPELVRIVKEDKDPYIREHAAKALRTTSIKSQRMLIDLLDEKDVKTRLAVAEALHGEYKGTIAQDELGKSAPKLKLLLHDDNAELRRAAAEALRFQMSEHNDSVPDLTKALADKDANVRHAAAINLLELGEAAKPALDEILKVTSDENTLFRRALTIRLPRVGPATIPGLTKLLADKDANVRAYAADGLGKFRAAAKESVPALKGLLKDMGDVYELQGCVCNFAGRALAEITGDKSYLDHLPPLPKDGL